MKWSIVLFLVAIAAAFVAATEEELTSYLVEPMPVVVEPETKHNIVARSTSRCNADSCTKHCRKLGHVRGVCIGSYCQCRALKKRSIPDPVPQIPEPKHKIVTRASCDPADCNKFCIKLGHKRGVCVGYCQCRSV